MSNMVIKTAIRTKFALTSRDNASKQIRELLESYLELAGSLNGELGAQSVFVPPMPGIDEDMRNWSFFMILEHNTIVNRSMSSIIQSLTQGEEPTGAGAIDPKKDVMPSRQSGKEQLPAFRASIEGHLSIISGLRRLRGTVTKQHPIFGPFDAHSWHCMFAFHLMIHYKQADYIVRKILAEHTAAGNN
ncbi:MAG: DinB family protein [bacterium]|nr:DinB family protein [bacterium]